MATWSSLTDEQKDHFGDRDSWRDWKDDAGNNAAQQDALKNLFPGTGGGGGNSPTVPVNGGFTQSDLEDLFGSPGTPVVSPTGPYPPSGGGGGGGGSGGGGGGSGGGGGGGGSAPEIPYVDPGIAPWQDQFAHEASMQTADLNMMMALQKDQQAHSERMNAKDRAASYMDSHANTSAGKWQGKDFTGGAAAMGQRQFAERAAVDLHKHFDFTGK